MTLPDVLTLQLTESNSLHVPGPHHQAMRIVAHLAEHDTDGPAFARYAFLLGSESIAIAWAQRPDDYADLLYPQYRELVRDRYWADIVGQALDAPGGPDPVHAPAIAEAITVALLGDPQLNDRPQQAN
ncbi:hypothetical protein AB0D10_01275 [Kitasatospora sp. NPDC048545]|uniref:hypothetical protein n=1 Tax=Kitasatospora sp. NPDC048545 TaxID=3157208 RepID=UPI0033FEA51C